MRGGARAVAAHRLDDVPDGSPLRVIGLAIVLAILVKLGASILG